MSDLGRWRDEGASDDERQLLEAARSERPDPALRARMLTALGISGAAPDGGGDAGAASTGSGRLLSLVKLATVVLAVGGAVTAGVIATRGQARPPAGREAATGWQGRVGAGIHTEELAPRAEQAAPRAEEPSPRAPEPAPRAEEPPSPSPAAPVPPTAPRRVRPRAPARGAPTLAEEVRLLEEAQRALATGDFAGALRACDRYQAAFAAGKLAPEETILRVRAMLATGDRQRAVSLGHAFVSAHPDSPYAARIRAIIE